MRPSILRDRRCPCGARRTASSGSPPGDSDCALCLLPSSQLSLRRSQQYSPTAPMGSPRVAVGQSWWPDQDLQEDDQSFGMSALYLRPFAYHQLRDTARMDSNTGFAHVPDRSWSARGSPEASQGKPSEAHLRKRCHPRKSRHATWAALEPYDPLCHEMHVKPSSCRTLHISCRSLVTNM